MAEVSLPLWLYGLLGAFFGLGIAFLIIAEDAYEEALLEKEKGRGWRIIPVVLFWPVTIPIATVVAMGEKFGRWAARQ